MTVLVFFFADLSAPAAVCLAVGAAATASIPVLLLPDAHRKDFDPRPAVRRAAYVLRLAVYRLRLAVHAAQMALEAGDWDGLLCAVANVKYAVRPSVEACRDAAALLLLLTTSPKGAMAA